MDIVTALDAARAPLTVNEIREYSGTMYSDERFESLIRSGEIKEVPGVPNTFWRVPPALRKRTTHAKCQSPIREGDRAKVIENVMGLRSKIISMSQELDSLRLRKDEMTTEQQVKAHMERLHRYNELKDIGQELLGRLAEIEKTKVENLYENYSLELDD